MTTGQRIKKRRKEIGLSAERLAEQLGVSPATIYRYENGDIEKISGDRLMPIAIALQTSPAYLMGWDDEKTPASQDAHSTGAEIDALLNKQFTFTINLDHYPELREEDIQMLQDIAQAIVDRRRKENSLQDQPAADKK